MRFLIRTLILLALAVGLAMLIRPDWGYVHIFVPGKFQAQPPTKLLVCLLIVGFFLSYFVVFLLRRALSLPGAVLEWRERRRRQRADRSLRESLLCFHQGRYAQSFKQAKKAYAASDHPVTAALLAARAAHALGDNERSNEWLERLKGDQDPNDKSQLARLVTEAELALDSRDFETAANALKALPEDGSKNNVAVWRLALGVAFAQERWEDVARLTRRLRKQRAISEKAAQSKLARANVGILTDRAGDGEALLKAWNAIPEVERLDHDFLLQAVPLMGQAGKGSIVRSTLEERLDKKWDTELASLYGYCGDESSVCLAKGEAWLNEHKRDPGMLYAMGRLCTDAQLWGKAEEYFAASLGLKQQLKTHLAIARLFDKLDRSADAQRHYRAAAEMAG